jgi:hypothetical protein
MLLLTGGSLAVSLPIDHSKWDAMLKKYVDVQALVDYRKWNETGKPDVETYLAQLARPWRAGMSPEEEKSALINAYNALTVEWVLQNFPITSIWRTDHPFAAARHTVNGRDISLNQIESRLRAAGDPRIHAALVCASRSCPPLRREAYAPDRIDQQRDDNARAWLSNANLNEFLPASRRAKVSPIFKWYAADFEHGAGSIAKFLARYAPASQSAFVRQPDAKIDYQTYDWDLNDNSNLGAGYSQIQFLWDYFRNKF